MNDGWTIRTYPAADPALVNLAARKGDWIVNLRVRSAVVPLLDLDATWRAGRPIFSAELPRPSWWRRLLGAR